MPFFIPVYDDESGKTVLYTSRQSTKTTYVRNKVSRKSMFRKGNSSLFIAPTGNQVTDFSRKKLDNVFAYNKTLRKIFVGKGCTWNVTLKEFTTRSVITLRSIGGHQGAERCRGITANDLLFDEYQNYIEEDVPVIMECAATFDGRDGRPKATYSYTGTPLGYQNPLEKQWNGSRKYEWFITCPHCGRVNDPIGMQHVDEGKDFFFCQHCKRKWDPLESTCRHASLSIL